MKLQKREGVFRKEALSAQRDKELGEPALAYPLTLRRVSAVLAASAILLVVFMLNVGYTQYVEAPGRVQTVDGRSVMIAGQRGVLRLEPSVLPGHQLKAGQLVGSITVAPSATAGSSWSTAAAEKLSRERDVLIATARQGESAADDQAKLLDKQLDTLAVQTRTAEQERAHLSERLELQEADLRRGESLLREGYVSEQYLNKLRADSSSLRANLAQLAQKESNLLQQAAALRQQKVAMRSQIAFDVAKNLGDAAEIDSRIAAADSVRQIELHASRDAVVTAMHVHSGDFVLEDTPILTSGTSGGLREVACYVDARTAAITHPGESVVLTFPTYPYESFGAFIGRVKQVDSTPWLGREEYRNDVERRGGARYRVVVTPDRSGVMLPHGATAPWLDGMEVRIHFQRERRTIFEWLFVPARTAENAPHD